MMYDVTALGELLIDFTPNGKSDQGNETYEANPGGAPCNVLSMLCSLNHKTAFIGKVGNDSFGLRLSKTLADLSIDTSGLTLSDDCLTTLAFVNLSETGERTFTFARKNSADVMLKKSEIPPDLIKGSRIFHCGSISLTDEPARGSTFYALEFAKQNNVCVSVDPNLREPLWKDMQYARESVIKLLEYADIIKISDYELSFIYNSDDISGNIKRLYEEFTPKIIFVTCGKDGAYVRLGDLQLWHKCYTNVKTIDTTGAGDAFLGACLHKLLEYDLNFNELSEQKCMNILQFASAAAALVTTKKGALRSMPSNEEIMRLIDKQ